MQNLPIGIQDFKTLREGSYIYVDKTSSIYSIINGGKYYFLSRPRRFGKSLLINTIAEVFRGNQAVFKGLWIEDQWDWNQTNPVIDLRFNESVYKDIGLTVDINRRLDDVAKRYSLTLSEENYALRFRELILNLYEQQGKVVVLIDEYDKPIIDFLDNIPQAEENREILKVFYSVLKPLDAHLQLVFITGVSKFSRVSIFSDLNNLQDISRHPHYNTICGYTQGELEHYFDDRIKALAEEHHRSVTEQLSLIRKWYNGYNWAGKETLYNPFSILNYFSAGQFQNFWFTTGTPTFLIKALHQRHIYNLDAMELDNSLLESFRLKAISTETLLFQTGYITIKKDLGFDLYEVGYPNQEVRESMLRHLMEAYTAAPQGRAAVPAAKMARAIHSDQVEEFCLHLNSLLASIPYDLHQDNEAYYHSIVFLALSIVGIHVQSEVHVATGRLDAIIQTNRAIYLVEFKVNQSAAIALAQIKSKNYHQSFSGVEKPILALGINFNTEAKKVDDWTIEEVKFA